MQIIYQSEKYHVAVVNPGRQRLVVTFDHRQKDRAGMVEPRPLKIANELGHSELMIRVSRNDWFLSDETEAVMSAVAEAASAYADVINYGFSMGGFGALLFSKATGARTLCAVAPQYSIDPEICTFETRWREEFEFFGRSGIDLADIANTEISGIVCYDPRVELDRLQAERIFQLFPNLQGCSFFFGGHPPTKTLREAGTIGQMGRDVVTGRATPATLRQLFRQARRNSGRYWVNLGKACKSRRPAVARHAFNAALALMSPSDGARYFKVANRLCNLGDYSHLAAMKEIAAAKKRHPGWWDSAINAAERESRQGST